MRALTSICIAVFATGSLAGCGASPTAPAASGQTSVLPGVSPAQAYTTVARQIKACWFNPTDPVLTRHVFRAEAGAGSSPNSQTNVVIYDRTPDGKRGLKAYSVSFEQRGKGTVVDTANHRLPYALGQKLTADVGYWIQGGATCDGPAAAASPARGSFVGPQQSVSGQRSPN